MNLLKGFLAILVLSMSFSLQAQDAAEDWYHMNYDTDQVRGVSADKAYEKLEGRESSTVVVAIIDSGVDFEHEDLKDVMWENPGEIPNNGKDDDQNGYVDDYHGWNFIGGPDGDVDGDNLEVTRLYRKYKKEFDGVSPLNLSDSKKKEYAHYLTVKKEVEKNRESSKARLENFNGRKANVMDGFASLSKQIDGDTITIEKLDAVEVGDNTSMGTAIAIARQAISGSEEGFGTKEDIKKAIGDAFQSAIDYFRGQYNEFYNIDFDPRHIVGDNYDDPNERIYGNDHFEGPDALHGTHVAGIVGANRNNDNPMRGIADNVRIMTVRAVPNGDERDKDVANAIRYAVDNGASIINMSFGKAFVWNKEVVDEAVKYAEENDVLMVHAAGNSNKNTDLEDNYPNDEFMNPCFFCKSYAKNWIEVGALSHQQGENYVAPFSNYGKTEVDLFAPGMQIYSTVPDDEYRYLQGTSMASPVVSGVSAILRSYFPTLTAEQVKDILMKSVTKLDEEVIVPGTEEKAPFSTLSVSGGVVNAEKAVELALRTRGKRKTAISQPRT